MDHDHRYRYQKPKEGCYQGFSNPTGSDFRITCSKLCHHLEGRVELLPNRREQPVAARLTQVLFDSLKPGGRLVIANYLPVQDSAYMETFMEWNLIYRTPEEILEMASDVHMDQVSEKRYTEEHSGTIGFLELSKASAMSFAA